MKKDKILLELIITNQCNKRCDYCDLNFKDKYISKKSINAFYNKYILTGKQYESLYINFFWWEPLLNFDLIIYTVKKFNNIKNIRFSIWTNWILLNKNKLDFCRKYNIIVFLSLDFDNMKNFSWNKLIKQYSDIIGINFIIQPKRISLIKKYLFNFLKTWFLEFNIMPVYTTQKWDNEELQVLKNIFHLVKDEYKKVNFFTYFKWNTSENQFILDTDWTLYNDIDSLLWLQKQYTVIPNKLKKLIDKVTNNWNINDNISLFDILNNDNNKQIEKIILSIPKLTKTELINKEISKIFIS